MPPGGLTYGGAPLGYDRVPPGGLLSLCHEGVQEFGLRTMQQI